MVVITIMVVLAWTSVCIFLGMHNIRHNLGGTIVFFFWIPIVALAACKYKYMVFRPFLWAIVMCLSCIEAINYLYIWFIDHQDIIIIQPLNVYILVSPLVIMYLPYLLLVEVCFGIRPSESSLFYEIPSKLRPLVGISMGTLLIPISILFPLIINPLDLTFNKYASGFIFGLLALNLGGIWLFIYIRDINVDTMVYFSARIKHMIPYNPKYAWKILFAAIAFTTWSVTEEFLFRRAWILWLESLAAIVPLCLIISRIIKILIGSQVDRLSVQPMIEFPLWRSGKHLGILIIFIMIGLICWFFF